ncbi:MAG: glucuronate isomerase, partial [Bacteroidales bacterium]|nr:glucuronate isomerase [Bacteroidales bacterium]
MKNFLDENFLLQTKTAQTLYHEYAAGMPIIDYHCHLNPKDIAEDRQFENLTQIWLYGDHYKWRAMRTNGVPENDITGDASDLRKFERWAETVPYTMRNPLYHWTHLELKTAFGIKKLLSPATAREIYDEASEKLRSKDYSVRNILKKYNVKLVCTTDDPVDSLEYHRKIKDDGFEIQVLPAWRPDKAMAVEDPVSYNRYLNTLSEVAGKEITGFSDLLGALEKQQKFFRDNGSRLSDHGIERMYYEDCSEAEVKSIFNKIRGGNRLDEDEVYKFKYAMLLELAQMDHAFGWVQQYHIGAIRNNNTRLFNQLGPDTGFDSIGDFEVALPLARFLDKLDQKGKLTKTILYNLNPGDNEVYATMLGNFQDGSVPGKIQFGSGWWFLDQKDGMERQMTALSTLGLLSRFVGMLTDSRSFLSYPRHEYFRRILCNLFGNDIENGELPAEIEWVGNIIKRICYYNARDYCEFDLPDPDVR